MTDADNVPEPGAADDVAARADDFLRRQRDRQEPSAAQQASMNDIVIEDGDMEDALALIFENQAEAKRLGGLVRGGKKTLKDLLRSKYQHTVNSDMDNEHTGWVICGRFRFRPQATEHDEAELTRHKGLDWEIDVEEVGRLV